jgi:WD40 repeat protein/serine/threonine protein kinase
MNLAVDKPVMLGDFELREQIGEGGFGTVYLAEQRALGRPAVVKVMRRSLAGRRDASERFVLEARLASRLDHPCAAHIYAFGAEPDGTLWIAMELVKGTSLSALVDSAGPQPIERVVPMIERLCEAVQLAHEQGIVHRDIKPANVMVASKSGRLVPKLLDFGIAKQLVATPDVTDVPAVRKKRATRPPAEPISGHDHTLRSDPEPTTASTVVLPPSGTATSSSLTQAGQILGSPPYMAPEQWIEPALVGPATDQYALALLAFEALAGHPACQGTTLAALAEQHIDLPLPRSQHISDAVQAVLARAAAKAPEDRYPGVEQFARALRDASGLGVEQDAALPVLSADVRVAWTEDAPQPIAEVIAALASARSPSRIIDRVGIAARVIARWLGILAITSRSRIGRVDAHAVTEALRSLRNRAPRDEEWLDLAVALAQPAAAQPEMWPVPELATWCTQTDLVAALRRLVVGDASIVNGDLGDLARATRDVATLQQALTGLAWVLDYQVGREVEGGVELWVGTRTDDRVVRRGTSDGSRVVLLDADGGRAVLLSPLVVIAPPMPGEEHEMFLFSGPARSGAALFCTFPRGFERDELAIWSWLAEHLFETSAGDEQAGTDERSPYPGLAAFTAADHGSFVGREREVGELVNRLRAHPIVAVVGPSGAGKSSFLAAGVVPALSPAWDAVIVRPGPDPIAMLSSIREPGAPTPYRDLERVEVDPSLELADRLVAIAERTRGMFVLVIDQAEELFTQGCDDAQRAAFASAVLALSRHPRARVVLGVRDDFLCRLDDLAPWRGVVTRHVQILGIPDREALERIVVEPARRRGFELEDPALATRMVDEVVARPGALPLLSFAASELWERRDRHFKRITTQAYEQIGGVAGALVQHADGVVDAMTVAERRLVRLAFRRLLTAEGARVVHGRAELVGALGGGAPAQAIVERLIAARLIVTRDDDAGERVEIIHEALTRTWPRLEGWRQEDASGAKLHEQLVAAARHWNERERPDGLLWQGDALAELQRWRRADERALTTVEQAFVQTSERVAQRARRRKVLGFSAAFAVLSGTVIVLAVTSHRISAQRAEAVRRVAAGFEERGRIAVLAGDNTRALLYLSEATRLGEAGPTHDLLVDRATTSVNGLEHVVLTDALPIEYVRWSKDRIVTIHEGSAAVWNRATGHKERAIPGASWADVAGDRSISIDMDGGVTFTDSSGKATRVERIHDGAGNFVGIASRGDVVATYRGQKVQLWTASGAERGALRTSATISGIELDGTGTKLAAVAGGDVQIWDVQTQSLQASCKTGSRRPLDPRFSPAGDVVVFGSVEGTVGICSTTTGEIMHSLVGHLGIAHSILIEPTHMVIASTSYDGTVRLWKLPSGEPLGVIDAHRGSLRTIALSPDGNSLATGADDGTIRIWDIESGTQMASLDGHAARITSLDWTVQDHLDSASFDGTVRRWSVTGVRHHIAHRHQGAVDHIKISPDGSRLLTHGRDQTALVWDVSTLSAQDPSRDHAPIVSAAFVGAHRVAAAGADGRLAIEGAAIETPGHTVKVASSDDGALIATSSDDGIIRLMDARGTVSHAISIGFAASTLGFDPSGRWLFALPEIGAPDGLSVIDTSQGGEVARLGKGSTFSDLTVDRTRLVAGVDRDAIVYQLGNWTSSTKLEHRSWVIGIALAPDGRVVTSSNDSTVTVWSDTGKILTTLPGTARGSSLDISSDNAFLAVGTSDGAIDVWDLASYRLVTTIRGHRMAVYAVKFSADGRRVFSAGQDGRVASWDLSRPHRDLQEVSRLVDCRVPLRLDGESVLPRVIDFNDPRCR